MPVALENCVAKLKEKGYEEQSAWGICSKALLDSECFAKKECCMIPGVTEGDTKMQYFVDSVSLGSNVTETKEGFLVFEGVKIARIGVQEYFGFEIGVKEPENLLKRFRVYRSPEELFKPESLNSLALKPVTNSHPKELLTVYTVKEHQKGVIGDTVSISSDGEHVVAKVMVTDAQTILDIRSGKVEVSAGSFGKVIFQAGLTQKGEAYDAVLVDILGNHVAIVQEGRCGGSCRVLDAVLTKEETQMSEPTTQAIADETAKVLDKLQGEVEKIAGERDALKAILDAKSKEVEELKAKADVDLDKLVSDRVQFISDAKAIDPTIDPTGKTSDAIMREIVKKKFPTEVFDGKSEVYMQARFDALKVQTDALAVAVSDAAHSTGSNVVNADEARKKFLERNKTAYLGGK